MSDGTSFKTKPANSGSTSPKITADINIIPQDGTNNQHLDDSGAGVGAADSSRRDSGLPGGWLGGAFDDWWLPRRLPLADQLGTPLHSMCTGLRNLGSTCYMNATLQCLVHCGPLVGRSLWVQPLTEDWPNRSSILQTNNTCTT